MRVIAVPCLSDNYAYLVTGDERGALVVDPSEAEPVRAALSREGLTLVAVLATHHHWDHVGGVEALVASAPGLPVVAHESERARIPQLTRGVSGGETFELGGLGLSALHVPGHTLGAVTFVCEGHAFTGDTLFCGGCGRIFEGTPAMMHASLEALARLPPETRVYPGHEYTLANLRFAAHVEPESEAVRARLARVVAARERGEPTVGASLTEELETNPFLRARSSAALAARYGTHDALEIFTATRREKDGYRG
jgi:hydroxyacylglutathione hydrolase